jgi:hypothetical protein
MDTPAVMRIVDDRDHYLKERDAALAEIKRLKARIAELEAERKLFLTSAGDMIEKVDALLALLKKKNGCGKIQEFVDKSVKRFAAMQK